MTYFIGSTLVNVALSAEMLKQIFDVWQNSEFAFDLLP